MLQSLLKATTFQLTWVCSGEQYQKEKTDVQSWGLSVSWFLPKPFLWALLIAVCSIKLQLEQCTYICVRFRNYIAMGKGLLMNLKLISLSQELLELNQDFQYNHFDGSVVSLAVAVIHYTRSLLTGPSLRANGSKFRMTSSTKKVLLLKMLAVTWISGSPNTLQNHQNEFHLIHGKTQCFGKTKWHAQDDTLLKVGNATLSDSW